MQEPSSSPAGYAAFVAAIERRLMGYLTFVTSNPEDAEDLFQEVCFVLHASWKEVSRMSRPDAWLFRVAHNRTVNRIKRRDAERRALTRRDPPGPRLAPNGEAEQGELTAAVEHAMAGLPVEQREALSLKIWGEGSWVEIGKTLGVSEDTAARLFARGLNALAPELRRFMP
jgi:RNA polymerase sigma-70 factor (ECF subfamily)